MAGWKTSLRSCTGCSHLGSSESHGWLLGFMALIRGSKQLPGLAVFVTSGDKVSAREEGLHPFLAHWRQTPAQRYVCNLIGISRIQQEKLRPLRSLHCFHTCYFGSPCNEASILTSIRARMQERVRLLRLCSNLGSVLSAKGRFN